MDAGFKGKIDATSFTGINELNKAERKPAAGIGETKKVEKSPELDLKNKLDINFNVTKAPTARATITFPQEAKTEKAQDVFKSLANDKIQPDGELYARASKIYDQLMSEYNVV